VKLIITPYCSHTKTSFFIQISFTREQAIQQKKFINSKFYSAILKFLLTHGIKNFLENRGLHQKKNEAETILIREDASR